MSRPYCDSSGGADRPGAYTGPVATFFAALLIGTCALVGVLALYVAVRLTRNNDGGPN